MTADPVAQMQRSNTVPTVSVDAILGIGGLLGFLQWLVAKARWSVHRRARGRHAASASRAARNVAARSLLRRADLAQKRK